jgi:hypothetical protein
MFAPSRDEVRRFFCTAWSKHRSGLPVEPQERNAIACILEHPEYQELLSRVDQALEQDFPVEAGRENPFLHLSLHLALAEQFSIDQPPGIRAALEHLQQRLGDRHAADHEAMECLGEILWRTQRGTLAADIDGINRTYLECLQRRLTACAPKKNSPS